MQPLQNNVCGGYLPQATYICICLYVYTTLSSVLMVVGSKKKKNCKRQCLSKSTLPSAVIKFEFHSADNSGYFKTNHTIEINDKEKYFLKDQVHFDVY